MSLELDAMKGGGKSVIFRRKIEVKGVYVCVPTPKGQTTPNRIALTDQIGNRKTDVL